MIGFEQRTHKCGEIGKADSGKRVLLYGWVHRVRDLGGVVFVHLRDVAGICQVVFEEPTTPSEVVKRAQTLRNEFVAKIVGTVRTRPDGMANAQLTTGDVEVAASDVEILAACNPLPFALNEDGPVNEALRLRYRFLDLRRPELQKNLIFRSRFLGVCRRFMESRGFFEVETPILTKSTPEGARDFLVPSRLSPGEFYALPQSPQLFKQILMIAGFDRYFQIVKCFRDEDLRADRQPEFTQLDVETSFTAPEGIFEVMEGLFGELGREFGFPAPAPFQRMPYQEAMGRYGSDKPDVRFGMEIRDVADLVRGVDFKVFTETLASGGEVKVLPVPRGAEFSRAELDQLVERSKKLGAKGLAWAKLGTDGKVSSPVAKFVPETVFKAIAERAGAVPGDLMLFCADRAKVVAVTLGTLRLELGKRQGQVDETKKAFLWVTDFPWLEWDDESKRWAAMHHPFTKPVLSDLEQFKDDPGKIRAQAYDLVLNGSEIGGGSVRIHRTDLQQQMFRFLNISDEEAASKFGFLLDALSYGAPPHAGIALGVDRIVSILRAEPSLREVIAFPKTQTGQCLMTAAPSPVTAAQLAELKLKTT